MAAFPVSPHTHKCSRGHPVSAHLGGQSMMSQSSCSHTVSQEAPAPADLSVGVRGLTGWPGSCQVCPVFPLAQALSGRPCACAQPPAPRGVQGASQVPLRPTLIPALAGKFIQCHNWLCCVLLCFLVFFFFGGGVTCLPLYSITEAPSVTMGFGGWLGPDQNRSHTP